jgi:hypothetical protein
LRKNFAGILPECACRLCGLKQRKVTSLAASIKNYTVKALHAFYAAPEIIIVIAIFPRKISAH